MKAMLLAAGRGERLRPLTDSIPKPLITAGSHRLIDYNLMALAGLGVQEVIVNVCYRAEQIIDYLGDGSRYGLLIRYSREDKACLGTGGGIFNALPLLGKDPFIVMSADIWSRYPFLPSFIDSDSEVHAVLVDNPPYHPDGDYALDKAGRLSKSGKKMNYAGIAKLHPRLFEGCKPGVFSLSPLINQAIEREEATGEYYGGPWFNVGTVAELKALESFMVG